MLSRIGLSCALSLTVLTGCGSHGYVSSDIPGVAETLGKQAIDRNTARTCPNYGSSYASYDRRTTRSGFTRRRVDYSFYCE